MSEAVGSDGPEAFVLTDNGVVHEVTCSHVVHQVEQHERGYEVQAFPEHEFIGHDSNGWSMYRERPATKPADPYSAHYVTASDLASRRARYRRCRTCAPDVAEWVKPERKPTSIRARSLTASHLGRVVQGAGELVGISVVLHTTDGDLVVAMDDRVALEPRRASDDAAPASS